MSDETIYENILIRTENGVGIIQLGIERTKRTNRG
jgi:hypothetical protein